MVAINDEDMCVQRQGQVQQLSAFYRATAGDSRIGATHISLYMALFQTWNIHFFENPLSITRHEIMAAAKINARATYHKCMRELEEYGYIRYIPSFNPVLKSIVYMLPLAADVAITRR